MTLQVRHRRPREGVRRTPSARRRWAWLIYIVLASPLVGVQFVAEGNLFSAIYEAVGLSSVVAIVVGIRIYRPRPSAPWWLMAAGQLLWVIGDALWDWYRFFFGHAIPTTSIADVLYLLAYPVLLASLALFVRSRREALSLGGWLDAAIVAVVCATLLWELAVQFYSSQGLLLSDVVSLAYPVMDVLLIGMVARFLFVPGRRTTSFRLLVAGIGIVLVADVIYARIFSVGPWSLYDLLDACWLTGYILTGAAALHPSMVAVAGSADGQRELLTRGRFITLGCISAAPLAVYVVASLLGQSRGALLTAVGVGIVITLAVIRLSSQVEALERQSAELGRLHRERGLLLDEITRAVEEERTRMAADLHDGPIQRLTALGLHTARASMTLERGDADETAQILDRVSTGLTEEIAGLRRLMMQLRPPILSERGLVDALREYCKGLAAERSVDISFEGKVRGRIDSDAETALYRIAQEALANALKHSGTRQFRVAIEDGDGQVRLIVADDGIGFDPGTRQVLSDGSHFGLLAMRERAVMLGGTVTIGSSPGKGTVVTASIPGNGAAGHGSRRPDDRPTGEPSVRGEVRSSSS
jgi:signal transduction histidine kinase